MMWFDLSNSALLSKYTAIVLLHFMLSSVCIIVICYLFSPHISMHAHNSNLVL